jgi:predicted ABC-class ATPase
MEAGCSALLIDEDTSATTFMVRDDLMQEVIHPEHEPITPFLERIRDLYDTCGISTIIVAGSSGAFFRDADRIIQMDHYKPIDITQRAKEATAAHPVSNAGNPPAFRVPSYDRVPRRGGDLRYKGRIKIRTNGTDGVEISKELIDLRYLEQLVTSQQLTCLGKMTAQLLESGFDGCRTLQDTVEAFWKQVEAEGFSALREGGHSDRTDHAGGNNRRTVLSGNRSEATPGLPGNLTMPRKQELYACINRYRKLIIK